MLLVKYGDLLPHHCLRRADGEPSHSTAWQGAPGPSWSLLPAVGQTEEVFYLTAAWGCWVWCAQCVENRGLEVVPGPGCGLLSHNPFCDLMQSERLSIGDWPVSWQRRWGIPTCPLGLATCLS